MQEREKTWWEGWKQREKKEGGRSWLGKRWTSSEKEGWRREVEQAKVKICSSLWWDELVRKEEEGREEKSFLKVMRVGGANERKGGREEEEEREMSSTTSCLFFLLTAFLPRICRSLPETSRSQVFTRLPLIQPSSLGLLSLDPSKPLPCRLPPPSTDQRTFFFFSEPILRCWDHEKTLSAIKNSTEEGRRAIRQPFSSEARR
ncbi:hypothetical protein BDY24DRAFT_208816 [Mrakia frigida]|uniref:uncharacterized protein n=1 Tax=Mrakia frigida TaxID=29902 RepID=UPI003FCC0965